jgi:SAM-dependent methyltransferase
MNPADHPLIEVLEPFRSLAEWQLWLASNQYVGDKGYAGRLLEKIRREGVVDPVSNQHFQASSLVINGSNFRETIRTGHLVSRHRAVLKCIQAASKGRPNLLGRKSRIYAPEGLTEFALYMRGRYPKFIGSEYADSDEERRRIFPILHQDLQHLTFDNDSFDLIVSNEVFEHVPDLDKALAECSRVLSAEGVLVATFPFVSKRDVGIRKATYENGEIKYLMEPEYHGNPMDPGGGSLVFEIPGWDLVGRAATAGFADAQFSFVSSPRHGVIGADSAGVFVFTATNG